MIKSRRKKQQSFCWKGSLERHNKNTVGYIATHWPSNADTWTHRINSHLKFNPASKQSLLFRNCKEETPQQIPLTAKTFETFTASEACCPQDSVTQCGELLCYPTTALPSWDSGLTCAPLYPGSGFMTPSLTNGPNAPPIQICVSHSELPTLPWTRDVS